MLGQGYHFWHQENWSELRQQFATMLLKELKLQLPLDDQWVRIKAEAHGEGAFATALAAHLGRPEHGLLGRLWVQQMNLRRRLYRQAAQTKHGSDMTVTLGDMAEEVWDTMLSARLERDGPNKFIHTLCRKLDEPDVAPSDRNWRNKLNQALDEMRSIIIARLLNSRYDGPFITPTDVEQGLFRLEEQVRHCCEFLMRRETFPELAEALLGRTLHPGVVDADVRRAVVNQISPDLALRWDAMSQRIRLALAAHDGSLLNAKQRAGIVHPITRIKPINDLKTQQSRYSKLTQLLRILYFVQSEAPAPELPPEHYGVDQALRRRAIDDAGEQQIGYEPPESEMGGSGPLLDDREAVERANDALDDDPTDDNFDADADDALDDDPADADGASDDPVDPDDSTVAPGNDVIEGPQQTLRDHQKTQVTLLADNALADELSAYSLAYQIGLMLTGWKTLKGNFDVYQTAGTYLLDKFHACDLFNQLGCDKHQLESVTHARLANLEIRLQGKRISTAKFQSTLAAYWLEFSARVQAKLAAQTDHQ